MLDRTKGTVRISTTTFLLEKPNRDLSLKYYQLFTPQRWLDMVMKHYEAKQYETELGPGGLMDNGNQTLFN